MSLCLMSTFDCFLFCRQHIELEHSSAEVYRALVTNTNTEPISSHHPMLRNLLIKMAAILESQGLFRIKTQELKEAISVLIGTIQSELSPKYLLSVDCKSHRNRLIAALISEIGFSQELQVNLSTFLLWLQFSYMHEVRTSLYNF